MPYFSPDAGSSPSDKLSPELCEENGSLQTWKERKRQRKRYFGVREISLDVHVFTSHWQLSTSAFKHQIPYVAI
ncbi:hypothetical protein LEMLEM_LOCUS17431 [Lemmus lemmus]